RAKLRASKPVLQPAASAKTVGRLQARVRELEADYAALYRAMEELQAGMERLVDPTFTRRRRASLNQMNARARLSRKRGFEDHAKRIVTGYQATCDLMYGPAQAENSTRGKRAAATRPARKGARAAT